MTQTNPSPRFTAREWNACGATQFYGKDKKRSYIVEVCLSEDIRGDLLQQAVDKALRRLPYYGTAASHVASMRVALNAGFRPAWAEVATREL